MTNIIDIFKITSLLDRARWEDTIYDRNNGRTLVNYADSAFFQKNPDARILSHYLCYITDRQMPYERIWNIGGFVFSELVKDYLCSGHKACDLLGQSHSCTHIDITRPKKPNDNERLRFFCQAPQEHSLRQERLLGNSIEDHKVYFSSRFVTTDYHSIYNVLYVLERLAEEKVIDAKSLVAYMKKIITISQKINVSDSAKNKIDIVRSIAYGLYALTYENVRNRNAEKMGDYMEKVHKDAIEQCNNLRIVLEDSGTFKSRYEQYCKSTVFQSKRIWCSIRDYLLDPEFKDYFIKEISGVLLENINADKYLSQLELPGDVWNNNDNFIQCLFPMEEGGSRSTSWNFNQYLRGKYDESGITAEYPEQFDVTFSLAPRMCQKLDCECCPYGILRIKEGKIDGKPLQHRLEELCINNRKKLCPIILHSTGYKFPCVGEEDCILCRKWKKVVHENRQHNTKI